MILKDQITDIDYTGKSMLPKMSQKFEKGELAASLESWESSPKQKQRVKIP